MGFAETMRVLTGIECGLASTLTLIDDKRAGKSNAYTGVNFLSNIGNGLARNEVAYEMQRHGNSFGNIFNSFVGYGNAESNLIGTIGLMSACSPWMFFNSPCCYSPMSYGCGGYGMGMGMYGMPYNYMGMGGLWC